jgi:hypothetical protein
VRRCCRAAAGRFPAPWKAYTAVRSRGGIRIAAGLDANLHLARIRWVGIMQRQMADQRRRAVRLTIFGRPTRLEEEYT